MQFLVQPIPLETFETYQYLEIDHWKSLSKFGEVTYPSILQTVLYFTDRHFIDWSVK